MKTAIYIEDGVVQLVMTPESPFEKNALSQFEGKELNAKLFSGSFYDCRGGWVRQSPFPTHTFISSNREDCSLILRVDNKSTSPSETDG